jgi:hypothetical protein
VPKADIDQSASRAKAGHSDLARATEKYADRPWWVKQIEAPKYDLHGETIGGLLMNRATYS